MTFEEKFAAQGRKVDEAKANLDEVLVCAREVRQRNKDEVAAEIARLDAKFDEFDAKMAAKVDKQLDKFDAQVDKQEKKVESHLDSLVAQTAESIAEQQKADAELKARTLGDYAAAEENARLLAEYKDNKRESAKLRASMRLNAAKQKVAERKEALDRAAEEEWVLDLVDYANACYDMAYSWAMEAEYTMMQVANELDYYNERFGGKE